MFYICKVLSYTAQIKAKKKWKSKKIFSVIQEHTTTNCIVAAVVALKSRKLRRLQDIITFLHKSISNLSILYIWMFYQTNLSSTRAYFRQFKGRWLKQSSTKAYLMADLMSNKAYKAGKGSRRKKIVVRLQCDSSLWIFNGRQVSMFKKWSWTCISNIDLYTVKCRLRSIKIKILSEPLTDTSVFEAQKCMGMEVW